MRFLNVLLRVGIIILITGCSGISLTSTPYQQVNLPITIQNIYSSTYRLYPLTELEPALQKVLIQQAKENIFNLDSGEPDGYLFLPAKNSVNVMIVQGSVVANSLILLTLKENKLVDQLLISLDGPDSETTINFAIDENYQIIVKKGVTEMGIRRCKNCIKD